MSEEFTVKEIVLRLEDKVDRVLADHEERIRTIEKRIWGFGGLTAIVSGLAALVGFKVG